MKCTHTGQGVPVQKRCTDGQNTRNFRRSRAHRRYCSSVHRSRGVWRAPWGRSVEVFAFLRICARRAKQRHKPRSRAATWERCAAELWLAASGARARRSCGAAAAAKGPTASLHVRRVLSYIWRAVGFEPARRRPVRHGGPVPIARRRGGERRARVSRSSAAQTTATRRPARAAARPRTRWLGGVAGSIHGKPSSRSSAAPWPPRGAEATACA